MLWSEVETGYWTFEGVPGKWVPLEDYVAAQKAHEASQDALGEDLSPNRPSGVRGGGAMRVRRDSEGGEWVAWQDHQEAVEKAKLLQLHVDHQYLQEVRAQKDEEIKALRDHVEGADRLLRKTIQLADLSAEVCERVQEIAHHLEEKL